MPKNVLFKHLRTPSLFLGSYFEFSSLCHKRDNCLGQLRLESYRSVPIFVALKHYCVINQIKILRVNVYPAGSEAVGHQWQQVKKKTK